MQDGGRLVKYTFTYLGSVSNVCLDVCLGAWVGHMHVLNYIRVPSFVCCVFENWDIPPGATTR
jgi:hypothetical protein